MTKKKFDDLNALGEIPSDLEVALGRPMPDPVLPQDPDHEINEALIQMVREEVATIDAEVAPVELPEALQEVFEADGNIGNVADLLKEVEDLKAELDQAQQAQRVHLVQINTLHTEVNNLKIEVEDFNRRYQDERKKVIAHHDTLPRNAYKACPFCKEALPFTPTVPTKNKRPWKGDRH